MELKFALPIRVICFKRKRVFIYLFIYPLFLPSFFAVIVRNKVPVSFVTGTGSRIETGKAIIGEIVPQGIEKLSA